MPSQKRSVPAFRIVTLALLVLLPQAILGCGGCAAATDADPGDVIARDEYGTHEFGYDVATDVDKGDVLTNCPEHEPATGTSPACKGSFWCGYAKMCCCQDCDYEYACSCVSGRLSCGGTDHCLGKVCSYGCHSGQFQTPEGCLDCNAIRSRVADGLEEAAAQQSSCSADADCVSVDPDSNCASRCPMAVSASGMTAFLAAAGKLEEEYCDAATHEGFGCPFSGSACPEVSPACIGGTCRLVGVCDAAHEPVGTPCDDKSACTLEDHCTAPGECKGTPVSCDDGNPCTTDTCDATTGCQHSPNGGSCPTAETCSLGAVCQDTVCVDLGLKGWVRTLDSGFEHYPVAVDSRPHGGFLLAAPLSGSKGTVLHAMDDAGSLKWSVTYPSGTQSEFSDMVAPETGGAALLGRTRSEDTDRVVVRRTDDSGTELWVAYSAPVFWTHPTSLVSFGDGRLGWTGTLSTAPNQHEAHVGVVSSSGDLVWEKTLGPSLDSGSMARIVAVPGGMVVLHTVIEEPATQGFSDYRVVRLDDQGNKVFGITIQQSGNDFPYGLAPLHDGSVVVAGNTIGSGKTLGAWVRRIGADGSTVWFEPLPAAGASGVVWTGASIAVEGYASYPDMTAHLYRLSTDGNLIGDLELPPTMESDGTPDLAAASGGLVMAGTHGFSPKATPWIARIFEPCSSGNCPLPGCQ